MYAVAHLNSSFFADVYRDFILSFCRLNDELLHCILKTVVRESCLLITKCQTVARDDFQKLLSTVPVWVSVQQSSKDHMLYFNYESFNSGLSFKVVSPSLRYLMAVQNHLLSNSILIRPDDNDDSDSSLQGETMKVQVNIPFKYPYLTARVCLWNFPDFDCLEILEAVLRKFGPFPNVFYSGTAEQHPLPGHQSPGGMWWSPGDPAASDHNSD